MSEKLQRTILRFQSRIESGEFYEAHQTLRTITNRYVKSQQYEEAIKLLHQGSLILSQNKEYASASDLIIYLISVYEESGKPCSNDSSTKNYKLQLIELVNSLPDTDPSLPELSKKCLTWSKNSGETMKFGDTELNNAFGMKFINGIKNETSNNLSEVDRSKLFAYSELHLILGTSESLHYYIEFLYEWYEKSKQQDSNVDPGVFLSRAVINYGYLKNINFIKLSINKFIEKLVASGWNYEVIEQDSHKIYFSSQQLMNFLQLLANLLTKEDGGNKFLKLMGHYKPILTKYELVMPIEYLGRFYFQLNLGNPNNNQNMLNNLMSGLFK